MTKDKKFDAGKYDFVGKARYIIPTWILISFVGIFCIAFKGLDYGIDFSGGTEIQLQFQKPVPSEKVRSTLESLGYSKATVQSIGEKNEFLIRMEAIVGKTDKETNELQNAMIAKVTDGLKEVETDNVVEVRRVDSVGPQVGEELKRNAILAAFYSLLLIMVYIGMRFDYKYAPGAVICLFHDAIIVVAIYSIFDREVNVQTMAAVLTLLGYSLNDTIINFDRIRENEQLYPDAPFGDLVNRSINDMLTRTIMTAFTTEMACAALYFLSDGVIQQIAFTLGVGILLGTYSSIYIASPLVIAMDHLGRKREKARLRAAKA
ncbi:MAG: protein translocase subunit SecF [Bdellovibrionales bacterium]|nr:protein translocase subunit SecF [Bdellovibrionales bacterium]